MRQRSQDSLNTAERNDKNLSFDSSIHIILLIFIHEFKVSLSRILLLLIVSLSGILSLKKSKWLRVSSLSNLPVSTVLLLNKSNNGKKWWLPLEPKDFESQRSCSFRGNDNGFEVRWEHLLCACLTCFTHLCVWFKHCFRLFVFTLSYIPTRLFTNRNHGNMSVLICSPDSNLSPSKLIGVIFAFREKKRRKSEKTYMTVRLPAESVASVQWGQLCNQKHKATVSDGMQMIRSS